MKKLHLGCGADLKENWINTDAFPEQIKNKKIRDQILKLDVTEIFPFNNDEFIFVYSEHMIEHLTYKQGLFMLKECYRVLKPGGILRIATPDILKILSLYNESKDSERYIKFSIDNFIKTKEYNPNLVINNFVRDWGHKFIYDQSTLIKSGLDSGFVCTNLCEYNESNYNGLEGLEMHGKNIKNEWAIKFETMIIEFTK